MTCKTHPDAPHGFVRGASHSEDRYVCECEFWEEPKMNERIKELAEQAGLRFTQLMSNPMVPVVDGKETDLEKFAELIVKECGVALNPMLRNMVSRGQAYDLIKQHFGVDE
jgi:hypothetical protein